MRSSTSNHTSPRDGRPWTTQAPSSSRSNAQSKSNTQVRPIFVSSAVGDQKRKLHPTLWDRISNVASLFKPLPRVTVDTASGWEGPILRRERSLERRLVRYDRQIACLQRSIKWLKHELDGSESDFDGSENDFDGSENDFDRPPEDLYRHPKYDFAWSGNAGPDGTLDDILSPNWLETRITLWHPKQPFIPEELLFFQDLGYSFLEVPTKQKRDFIRRYDKALFRNPKNSYFQESLQGFTVLDSDTQHASAEGGSDGVEEGYNVTGSDGDFDKLGAARWRAGPGRKKSWKASPQGKVPSRRQRRRGKRTIRNIEHSFSPSKRQQQDQRLDHEKHSSDLYLQIHQHRSAKHRAHYIWVDDIWVDDIWVDDIQVDDIRVDDISVDDIVQYTTSTEVAYEPRIIIHTAAFEDDATDLIPVGQMITATRHESNDMYDVSSWAFRRSPRDEAYFQSLMADLPPRPLNGPVEKASGRGKKHKQRGLNKLKIPRFNDLEDIGRYLKKSWSNLLDKSDLLLSMATKQESTSIESYLKLYKTVQARRRQLTGLETVYATINAKYKGVENEERAMNVELNRIHRWLISVAEQNQVMALHSALHRNKFNDVLPQIKVRSPPRCPLLHKNRILRQGPDSMAQLLHDLDDDWNLQEEMDMIYKKIAVWSEYQLSILVHES